MTSSIEIFKDYYKKSKELLDKEIEKYNNNLKEENELLNKNIQYFKDLNTGGKDIRGILIMLGYNLLEEENDYSIPLAVAYEVFQTAILVHDDIIDEDEKRRGKETIHQRNFKEYKELLKNTEAKHFGDSIALCVGDYGLYSANKIITSYYRENPNLGNILDYFNDIVLNTIRGEMLDVLLPIESRLGRVSAKDLDSSIYDIYRLKTSYYTIIGPLCMGLILGNSASNYLNDMEIFGEKVGIAFQIQDDILGIFSEEMGKVKGSDMKEFKQTILYSHIIETPYKEEFLSLYGTKELNDDKIQRVKELLELSGTKEFAIEKMNQFYDEGLNHLRKIEWITPEKKEILIGFVDYLRTRKK